MTDTVALPPVSLVWAMASNRVIGRDNALPWHLPADLKRFRMLTGGHYIVMGRKTFESFPKPLPDRTHIVVTQDRRYRPAYDEVIVAHSIDDALTAARGDAEIFVIGGASIYEQTVTRADRLYVTLVHADVEGDAQFPVIDWRCWRQVKREDFPADARHAYAYSFIDWVRV